MARLFNSATKQAIFDKLTADLSETVFDHIPHQPEGRPDNEFPYVAIPEADNVPWDNDDDLGAEITVSVFVLSRYKGRTEADQILDSIYASLHRASLTTAGYNFVDCLFEFSDVITLDDGQTRLGTARYRVTIQEA